MKTHKKFMEKMLLTFFTVFLVLISESILASCPAGFELKVDKQFINHHANLCWKQSSSNKGDLYILVDNNKGKSVAQRFPVENENEIRNISFDERDINLKEGQLSLAVNIESRVHETEHDEEATDLWLFQIDNISVKKVFETQIQYASWATKCKSDCRDTLHSESTLKTGAIDKVSGFKIIKLQNILTTIPYNQPDSKGKTKISNIEYHFSATEYTAN